MEQKNWNLLDEALGLNNNNAKPWPLCGRFVLVEDCVDTSAAFVLHQILKRSFSSHPSSAVVFLAFSHPFSHYDRVLRKLVTFLLSLYKHFIRSMYVCIGSVIYVLIFF